MQTVWKNTHHLQKFKKMEPSSQMIGLNSSQKKDAHHLHDLNYGSILFNSCNLDGLLPADAITICMKKINFHLFQIASLIAGFIRN